MEGGMEVIASAGDWLQCTDGQSEFWYNKVTKEVSLDRPEVAAQPEVPEGAGFAVPDGMEILGEDGDWLHCRDDGREFWYHKVTKDVSLEPPTQEPLADKENAANAQNTGFTLEGGGAEEQAERVKLLVAHPAQDLPAQKQRHVSVDLIVHASPRPLQRKPDEDEDEVERHKEALLQWLRQQSHLHLMGKRLTHFELDKKSEKVPLMGKLRIIYAYENRLVSVSGLSARAPKLERLYLQDNCLRTMEQWSEGLQHLKQLHLQSNSVTILAGLHASRQLEELYLNDQRAPFPLRFAPSTLQVFARSLRILDVARDRVSDLAPLSCLLALEDLNARENDLQDMRCVLPVLYSCRRLSRLQLHGNPLTQQRKYRDEVVLAAEALRELDGKDVQPQTRTFLRELLARKEKAARRSQAGQAGQEADRGPGPAPFAVR